MQSRTCGDEEVAGVESTCSVPLSDPVLLSLSAPVTWPFSFSLICLASSLIPCICLAYLHSCPPLAHFVYTVIDVIDISATRIRLKSKQEIPESNAPENKKRKEKNNLFSPRVGESRSTMIADRPIINR